MLKKAFFTLTLAASLAFAPLPAQAETLTRYEYKMVKLGSLTALQKKKNPQADIREIEGLLNDYGGEGWEIVNIFAVRTTFDPNVFFVVMKRPLAGTP